MPGFLENKIGHVKNIASSLLLSSPMIVVTIYFKFIIGDLELGKFTYLAAIVIPIISLTDVQLKNFFIIANCSDDIKSGIGVKILLLSLTLLILGIVALYLGFTDILFLVISVKLCDSLFDISNAILLNAREYDKMLIQSVIKGLPLVTLLFENLIITAIMFHLFWIILLIRLLIIYGVSFYGYHKVLKEYSIFGSSMFIGSLTPQIPKYFLEATQGSIVQGLFSFSMMLISLALRIVAPIQNYYRKRMTAIEYTRKEFLKVIFWQLSLFTFLCCIIGITAFLFQIDHSFFFLSFIYGFGVLFISSLNTLLHAKGVLTKQMTTNVLILIFVGITAISMIALDVKEVSYIVLIEVVLSAILYVRLYSNLSLR